MSFYYACVYVCLSLSFPLSHSIVSLCVNISCVCMCLPLSLSVSLFIYIYLSVSPSITLCVSLFIVGCFVLFYYVCVCPSLSISLTQSIIVCCVILSLPPSLTLPLSLTHSLIQSFKVCLCVNLLCICLSSPSFPPPLSLSLLFSVT